MACSLEDFIRATIDSGLLSVAEVKAFMLGIPQAHRPTTAEQLAKELVLANKLTKYQAAAIYQGKQKGLVLGQYAVLDQIGAGAMGQVFKAQHRRMKRIVAIKVLPSTSLRSSDAVERFQREVHAAARLLHPNIVAAYDADESDGVPFLVLEYVDGADLKTLYQNSLFSVGKALDYIIQAARGLEYAHSQGVVHRDIKPANLLVDQEGVVRILDMGLARIHKEVSISGGLTRSGEIMGTVDYMAPEQAASTHDVDGRADQYSLGCTLYRLLTGESVYPGESMVSKIVAHRKMPIPALRAARSDVPAELDAVYQKMLAKNPDDRYPSMTEAIAALESCVGLTAGKSSDKPSISLNQENEEADSELKNFLSSLAGKDAEASQQTARSSLGATTIRDDEHSLAANVDVNAPFRGDETTPPAPSPARRKFAWPKFSKTHWLLLGGGAGAAGLLLATAFTLLWFWRGSKPPKPGPASPPRVVAVDPNDLLGRLDLNRDTIAGRRFARIDEGALVVSNQVRVQLAREIPEEYDLTLVVEKKERVRNEALVVGLPIAGKHRSVILAWLNGDKYETGFTGKTVYDQPVFTDGQPNTVLLKVRADNVVVERDGEKLIEYQGDVAALPVNDYWHVPIAESFFLGFSAGEWRVTKWQLTPVAPSDAPAGN